jgi:hypothetical protein
MLEIFSTGKMTQNAASYQPNQIFAKLRWRLTPSGWLDRNRALVATLESQLISAIDVTNQTISPGKSQAAAQMIKRATTRINPYNFLAAICTPNFSDALPAIGRTQTTMDQARIVCGLERYRLANGQYPTNLAALLPRFLDAIPRDVISGKPMNYGRKDEQTFLLYSIGWNETDDGGITVRKKDGKEDSEAGDWVWHEDSN